MIGERPKGQDVSRRAFLRVTAAAAVAGGTLRASPAGAAEQKVNNVLIEADRWLLPAWETLTDSDDAGVASTLRLVGETQRMLQTKDVTLLLVVVPFKARYCDTLDATEIAPAVASRYDRALVQMANGYINFVNLDQALRAVRTPASPLYYRTDQHWTDSAVQAAAGAVVRELRGFSGHVDGGRTQPLNSIVKEKHIGDLATLLPAAQQSQLGPESYDLRTPYDGDLNGYNMFTGALPEPEMPPAIQIVGSSFVRPMWGFPQTVAHLTNRPVGLTFFNGDAGPYHTLLMNLRSTLPKRRPTFIVWQMTEANLHLGPAANGWWSVADLMSVDFFLSHVRDIVKGV